MHVDWRYKRFHVSYLLAWMAAGLLVGLFVGQFVFVSWWVAVTILAVGIVVPSMKSRRWYACALAVVAGFVFGLVRGELYNQDVQRLSSFVGQRVTVEAVISQDPILTNGSNTWQAQLAGVRVAGKPYAGELYATVLSDETLKRGDSLTIAGKAGEGFGNFRLTMYRANILHVLRPDDPFLAARDHFADGAKKVMPEPEASLGLGFLVGQKSALPPDLTEQLKIVGLTHIVVASGYNLTILVRFARKLLARRSRYLALAGSLLFVAGFVLVSGFSPSMNRAAVVTFLTLVAWYYGRKFHPVLLITYVAALSGFVTPSYVWGDLGWLLSFAAFTGVLVMAPIVTALVFKPDKQPGALARLVIETVSAEIMTLPIIVASFGYVPVLALVANVLVAPVIPFAMFLTFVSGLVGLLAPWFALLALPASIVIAYVVAIVENLASPEWARFALELPMGWLVVWYGLLTAGAWYVWKRRRVDLQGVSVVE